MKITVVQLTEVAELSVNPIDKKAVHVVQPYLPKQIACGWLWLRHRLSTKLRRSFRVEQGTVKFIGAGTHHDRDLRARRVPEFRSKSSIQGYARRGIARSYCGVSRGDIPRGRKFTNTTFELLGYT